MIKLLTTVVAGVAFAAATAAPALAYVQPTAAHLGAAEVLKVRDGGCFDGERSGDCRERQRWESRHNHRYEWRDGRYYEHRRDNDAGAAIVAGILGFALGAAIAGSQDDSTYYDNHREDRNWRARCQAHYRSFDGNTGTYLSRDGYRRYCRL